MTQAITPLRPTETIEFDHGTLSDLCDTHGTGAEAFISHALSEIEVELQLARTQYRAGHLSGLGRTCAGLTRLARRIGMQTLDRCAAAVMDRLATNDVDGLAACMGRLGRLTDPDTLSDWHVRQDNDRRIS